MFNELFTLKKNDNSPEYKFACVKSVNVQAYPCGRRRFINTDFKESEDGEVPAGIPFDPEARLNTEANNRRAASVNGYTNTYLAGWDSDKLSLSLAGYQFNIDCSDMANFITNLEACLGDPTADNIYANIVIQNVPLSSGDAVNYYTGILRDQPALSATPSTFLDKFYSDGYKLPETEQADQAKNWDNYYFSGLSFSTVPLVNAIKEIGYNQVDGKTFSSPEELIPVYAPLHDDKTSPWSILNSFETDNKTEVTLPYQQIVSLCILKKEDKEEDKEASWQVYQPALLPQIVHGDTPDSIKVGGDIKADSISVNKDINIGNAINANVIDANEIKHNGSPIVTLHVATKEENDKTTYQLQFSFAKKQ